MFNENRKIVVGTLIVIGVILTYLVYRFVYFIHGITGIVPNYWWLGQVILLLSALLVATLFYFFIYKSQNVMDFLTEVVVETKKVVWPTFKQTKAVTLVVLVLVIVSAVILACFDYIGTLLIDELVPFIFGY